MKKTALVFVCSLMFCLSAASMCVAAEKWPGVDDTVVGKYAAEHGRPARPGLINLEGDALLFAFLAAGVLGGFVMGYCYRDYTAKKGADGVSDEG